MFKTFACLMAASAALATAVPAVAGTRMVRFDDLNLATPAGVDRLESRIAGAARQVCGARDDYRQSLVLQAATKKCIAEAKARAMDQVARLDIGAARGG